jgi:hypothetical protein
LRGFGPPRSLSAGVFFRFRAMAYLACVARKIPFAGNASN